MRQFTTTHNVYKWSEVSDELREKILTKLWDINIDHEWWEFQYEDAERIGVKITAFDIDRGSNCDIEFTDSARYTAETILKEHGKDCDTFKLSTGLLKELKSCTEDCEDCETRYDCEDCLEHTEEFKKSLSEEFLSMLRQEFEWRVSEESIVDTIEANEYEFLESGDIA